MKMEFAKNKLLPFLLVSVMLLVACTANDPQTAIPEPVESDTVLVIGEVKNCGISTAHYPGGGGASNHCCTIEILNNEKVGQNEFNACFIGPFERPFFLNDGVKIRFEIAPFYLKGGGEGGYMYMYMEDLKGLEILKNGNDF